MPTEVSKIEKIIKQELDDETKTSIDKLVTRIAEETQRAVERINGVYGSAISTLEKLELTEVSIFDFFQKTNGNIRVVEIKTDYSDRLYVQVNNRDILHNQRCIDLKGETKYKIIIMAMEIKEDGAGTNKG